MDFQNVPSYNEVISWSPEALSDYFRVHSLKECEKPVRKNGITGKRFLEMSENDMQKFPKLAVPMLVKVQQAMNRKEEKRGFFPKRTTQRGHQETEYTTAEDKEVWSDSSFEDDDDDDYVSPDEEGAADYESPEENMDDEFGSDDYEPPPSNNEEVLPGIFPSKPSSSNPDYIDRNPVGTLCKGPPQPPVRPGMTIVPTKRGSPHTGFPPPFSQEDRVPKPLPPLGPKVNRENKPSIGPPNFSKGFPVPGKKPSAPTKATTLPNRQMPEKLPDLLKKPPLPREMANQEFRRPSPSPRSAAEKLFNAEEDGRQRQLLQPSPFSSNTFPLASQKPSPKNAFSGSHTLPLTDSSPPGVPLPPPHKGNMSRSFSEGVCNGRPPAPIPVPQQSLTENEKPWYTGSISRSEAERALRSINQDGTFLVRDSSKATSAHPYVLMVLYKDKVYNVQMRYDLQKNIYYLGSGLRGQENFTSVSEIIEYFQRVPLLLIDGKDRGSRQHCLLTYSAGCNLD